MAATALSPIRSLRTWLRKMLWAPISFLVLCDAIDFATKSGEIGPSMKTFFGFLSDMTDVKVMIDHKPMQTPRKGWIIASLYSILFIGK